MAAGTAGRPARAGWNAPMLPGRGPLAGVPAIAAFAGVVVLFTTAVLVGGTVGALLLGVLVVGVVALLSATWSRLSPVERVGRLVVLGVLIAVALGLLFGAGR